MPSSPGYVRNYAQERLTAIKRGETSVGPNSKDAMRHKARRLVEKRIGKKLPTSVQVDHKKPLKSGVLSANESSNLRVRDAHSNMSAGGKSGSKEGKAAGGKKGAKKRKSERLPVKKPD